MPVNTRAYPQAESHQSATRHRVDRQDELCEDVAQRERWVVVELRRVDDALRVVAECDGTQVEFDAGDVLPGEVPGWTTRVLDYLDLADLYEAE